MKSHVGHGWSLTDELVDEMADVFYRCTACRRCTLECPLGIDHGLITRLGRYILSMTGIAPKALQVSVREQLEGETHNTSKLPQPALVDTLEFLAEEMEESLGVKLKFPLDQPDRDYGFFCAVSDYLMEPETLMGNAAVLYAAGDWDRWTIGTRNFDAINYGLFYSDWHLERIIKRLVGEAKRLRAGTLLIGECGHASRSACQFVPVFAGQDELPGEELHRVHTGVHRGGEDPSRPGHRHREGHLPRPVQHRPLGLDRGAAATRSCGPS